MSITRDAHILSWHFPNLIIRFLVVFISTCLVTVTPQCILLSEMVKKISSLITSQMSSFPNAYRLGKMIITWSTLEYGVWVIMCGNERTWCTWIWCVYHHRTWIWCVCHHVWKWSYLMYFNMVCVSSSYLNMVCVSSCVEMITEMITFSNVSAMVNRACEGACVWHFFSLFFLFKIRENKCRCLMTLHRGRLN